ncbi:MAG: Gfo/Idh/MocA family oxidoreductase [Patescibacteria group bacterium]
MNKNVSDLRLGCIGAGRHATANMYPSLELLGARIQSIATQHKESAEAAARRFHAQSSHDDYRTMLEKEKLDAVVIVTTGDRHAGIVKNCLLAGVPVFVEKPLGWNEKEARDVADVSKKTGKTVMVGYMKRFAPSYKIMHERMESKKDFGDILTMHGMFGVRNFGTDIEAYLRYGAIHTIDLLRYYMGEVSEVQSFAANTDQGVSLTCNFRFVSGKNGLFYFAGLPSWGRHFEEMTITGTHGFLKVENISKLVVRSSYEPVNPSPGWQQLNEKTEVSTSIDTSGSGGLQALYMNGYVYELEHFLRCLLEHKQPMTSAEDNVKTTVLVDRILVSLQ